MAKLQQYFWLQANILKRQLNEFGVSVVTGCILILALFYGFSIYLFAKIGYANLLYILLALSVIFKYSETNRNDFLKFTFSKNDYFKIRIVQNLVTILPFIIFLCFKIKFYSALLLVALSIVIIFLNTAKKGAATIPTPFYKKPFEFIVGFRVWICGFLFAYFITIMSVVYQNFNLGLFSLILIFLICLTFYAELENEFYVWVYALKTRAFLFDKIKAAILFSTILSLPIVMALLFFFHENSLAVIGIQLIGYFYLLTVIVAKYAAYPQKMNLPQTILLVLSMALPPLALVSSTYFYIQSTKRLKEFLG